MAAASALPAPRALYLQPYLACAGLPQLELIGPFEGAVPIQSKPERGGAARLDQAAERLWEWSELVVDGSCGAPGSGEMEVERLNGRPLY